MPLEQGEGVDVHVRITCSHIARLNNREPPVRSRHRRRAAGSQRGVATEHLGENMCVFLRFHKIYQTACIRAIVVGRRRTVDWRTSRYPDRLRLGGSIPPRLATILCN